ncbi:uncharacterized protein LOC110380227 [Helicoverpa armigera]|uniref:uncharacterized protein LOC110380227 n=1 Tax=Helicoverpa armigera TaxID=29058 RepID=UPI001F5798DD|nr:uncharacterized protein LOC124638872 [Helicoverpa zea]
MSAKIVLVICALVAMVSAVPAQPGAGVAGWGGGAGWGAGGGAGWGAGAANPWIPPWLAGAPWFPQWTPCTTVGSSCVDCSTRLVCTKIGGLQRACTDPTLPYCNLGECSATPAEGCGVPAAAPRAAGAV